MAAGVRFYFCEDIGRLTLSQIRDRQAFLADRAGDGIEDGSRGDCTNALASGVGAMMARGDRKEIPLGEVIGYL